MIVYKGRFLLRHLYLIVDKLGERGMQLVLYQSLQHGTERRSFVGQTHSFDLSQLDVTLTVEYFTRSVEAILYTLRHVHGIERPYSSEGPRSVTRCRGTPHICTDIAQATYAEHTVGR